MDLARTPRDGVEEGVGASIAKGPGREEEGGEGLEFRLLQER